ncbi:hypothetical protein [Caulobacter sp. RL271]|jgi:hypothetical protein|uniref:Uncharacterized protein n=1 Tax=Caulobacter segnis TaxID=88688 RepID=A0ABY4ZQ84_9CAUL|nr:hypothetical protein [Caulobacter segnis]USQ94878.1 hypothetical protein MZV50_20270 [Caulobacter segnis]
MTPADPTTAKFAALSAKFALGVGETVLNLALSAAVPVSLVVFAVLTF